MREDFNEIVIVGCGGVGSNLAYMLSKSKLVTRINLIDFDKIEHKNLERQFFIEKDIGQNKAQAVASYLKQFAPDKEFFFFDRKIDSEEKLLDFPKDCFAFICTDNVESKKIISNYFTQKIVIGCDNNIVDIRNKYDGNAVWTLGEGYNSTQNFESNLLASTIAFILYERGISVPNSKVSISKVIDDIRLNKFDRTRVAQGSQNSNIVFESADVFGNSSDIEFEINETDAVTELDVE